MFGNNKRKKPVVTKTANTTSKTSCRRNMTERRQSNIATRFPLVDGNGSKVSRDRRWRPDRRYDVEIQWLRG